MSHGHGFESSGSSGGHSHHAFNDHPNRAGEASVVRALADQVNTSSPERFDAALQRFQSEFRMVQTVDPHFFGRLADRVNTSFKPTSYGMASSEQLLGNPDT
jgi:hypothetical protein